MLDIGDTVMGDIRSWVFQTTWILLDILEQEQHHQDENLNVGLS
ncbi:hypothetical protein JL09_g5558 [Pichia kudriavzevii]|nr:hypothetical protein JL09_g5558 [Pichia kudriavzevii]